MKKTLMTLSLVAAIAVGTQSANAFCWGNLNPANWNTCAKCEKPKKDCECKKEKKIDKKCNKPCDPCQKATPSAAAPVTPCDPCQKAEPAPCDPCDRLQAENER